MSGTVRVYVDGQGVDVSDGATVLDAVRARNAEAAAGVTSGTRAVTDSRGLPLDPSEAVFLGAIYRVVGARGRADEPDDTHD